VTYCLINKLTRLVFFYAHLLDRNLRRSFSESEDELLSSEAFFVLFGGFLEEFAAGAVIPDPVRLFCSKRLKQ